MKACLARHCSPKEDIDATLAHAENAFVAGDYRTARTTLLASIRRNRKYAASLPVEVSDLLRAHSRIAAHLGEKENYLAGARDVAGALKAGLPANDPRILDARIEIGDSQAGIGNITTAVDIYRSVIKQADRYGLPQTAAYARLRIANLYSALAESDRSYRQPTTRELDELAALTDPGLSRFAAAARVLKARAAASRGDMSAINHLIAGLKAAGETTPILLYAPPLVAPVRPGSSQLQQNTLSRMQMSKVDDQWVDIGFWIGADGKVGDIEILRESPTLSGRWVEPVKKAIAGRRYAPFTPQAGKSGMQRVERYTLTAFWTTPLGSRMRVREPETRIEMLDLTS